MQQKHLSVESQNIDTFPLTRCPACGKQSLSWTPVSTNPDRLQGRCGCFLSGAIVEIDRKSFAQYAEIEVEDGKEVVG